MFIFRQVNIGGLHTKIGTSRNKGISYNSLKISSQQQINFNWKQTVKKNIFSKHGFTEIAYKNMNKIEKLIIMQNFV